MIFTSFEFLFFITVLFFLLYLVRSHSYQIYVLLLASYIFYGAWNPSYVLLIMATSFIGWSCGYLMGNTENIRKRKLYLSLSIIGSLSILAYFKYANFFIENIELLTDIELTMVNVILPVGISFFTFQCLSYTIDLYRKKIPVCHSIPRFFLFVAFFPQLVAGPIVRASEFLPQLNHPIAIKQDNLLHGLQIFLIGAFQKVIIANNLSPFVDRVFEQPEIYSSSTVLLSVICYSIQIFCDFSGYSLMAIGVAYALGFKLPENFRMPYLATSITEFWRRWHLTLSFWLRDYLYISLGGNRRGNIRTLVNLIVTMVLGGLWHGASWNFVLWGFMHGLGLVIHKFWSTYSSIIFGEAIKNSLIYKIFAWSVTYFFVLLLWIPFRSTSFEDTLIIFQKLIQFEQGIDWHYTQGIILILLTAIWHIAYLFKNNLITKYPYIEFNLKHLLVLGILFTSIVLFAPMESSPFIYFQF